MNRLFDYIRQSRLELTRVTWPNRPQTIRLTVAVIVFAIAVAGFIGGVDFILTKILEKVILKG